MQEESIYNLLVPEKISIQKERKHKSRHDPRVPPTGSTFIHHTTARPVVHNLNGEQVVGPETHTHKGEHQTFGMPTGSYRQSSQSYTKKGTGRMGSNQLPEIKSFKYKTKERREPIPSIVEKPIMGIVSDKDYIKTNIVENVTTAPKKLSTEKDWTKKKNFGKVPGYLKKAKNRINEEYEYLRYMQESEEDQRAQSRYLLSPEEVNELREALKKKWEHVNREYQSITHINQKATSNGIKRKKERCEEEMKQVERDIEKLNKQYIFVDMQS